MKASEAAALLTFAASIDGRHVGESTARAWAEIIDPNITYEEGLRHIKAHYAHSRWPIMPSDINGKPGDPSASFWDKKPTND